MKKKIVFLLFLAAIFLNAQERMALILGNGKYQSHHGILQNVSKDIEIMKKALESVGFSIFLGKDMKIQEMKDKVENFIQEMEKRNPKVVVVYYAGHGIQVDSKQYLLPLDMPDSLSGKLQENLNNKVLVDVVRQNTIKSFKEKKIRPSEAEIAGEIRRCFKESLLRENSLATEDILSRLDTIDKRVNIVILNACRKNGDALFGEMQQGETIQAPEIQGMFVAYTTSPGEAAYNHTIFAESFANFVKEDMTVNKLMKAIGKKLSETQRMDCKDRLDDEFYFLWPLSVNARPVEISNTQGTVKKQENSWHLKGTASFSMQVIPDPEKVYLKVRGKDIYAQKKDKEWVATLDTTTFANDTYSILAYASRKEDQKIYASSAMECIIQNPIPESPVSPPALVPSSPVARKTQEEIKTSPTDESIVYSVTLTLLASVYDCGNGWTNGEDRNSDTKTFSYELKKGEIQNLQWSCSADVVQLSVKSLSLEIEEKGRLKLVGMAKLEDSYNKVQDSVEIKTTQKSSEYLLNCQGSTGSLNIKIEIDVKTVLVFTTLYGIQEPLPYFDHNGTWLLDMSDEAWCNLTVEKQIALASLYQKNYAQSKGIPIEKTISGISMRLIPPGRFWMGSPEGEKDRGSDEKRHRVIISKAFYVGKYEVTQAQWQAVMGNNPAYFKDSGSNAPVEQVSWNDCQKFCKKTGFKLLTEAQWEYACRAGTTTPFNLGENMTPDQVNYNGNYPYAGGAKGEYRIKTVACGSLPNANAWGCYDFHGNVWEWCQDKYQEYSGDNISEPEYQNGSSCLLRGGSWLFNGYRCRSAFRLGGGPDDQLNNLGLRCLCIP
ncbi:MAG: SUMF1/EgtB/PvdO family nonheme iron enzyme [Candidatus Brocadiae bacterium]|nr:SUMF1/EgtB/PvdO family nonheme iron enzyme [Candidatus Brocadiia bacterium]